MDKPKVTIKINGKERSFYEEKTDTEKKNVRENAIHTGEKVEKLTIVDIDEVLAKEEVAAANQEEEEFDWILPQQSNRDSMNDDSIVSINELRKKKSPTITSFTVGNTFKKKKSKETYPLKTLLLSIISALVIGTCFGMVVLRMFTGETIPVATSQAEQVGKDTVNQDSNNSENVTAEVKDEPFIVPSLDVFLVQGGAFSEETAATPIIENIKSKGLAGTTVNIDGKHFLFLGIGLTKEIGTTLRKPYDNIGQETYVKTVPIPEKSVTGNPEVRKARQLFDDLLTYTTNKYSSTTQSIEWANIVKLAEGIKKSDDQSISSSYIASVIEAYEKSVKYESSGETKDFWGTQQALLTSYEIYQKWILEKNE